MPFNFSIKSNGRELLSIVGLIVILMVLPIITLSGFNSVDKNFPQYTSQVLGVNDSIYAQIDPTRDNTPSLTTFDSQDRELDINNWGRKTLILIVVILTGVITFTLVTLVSHKEEQKN